MRRAANKNRTQLNERGFAAIVIAGVLIVVLSLITVGFAELMRHEQRDALDKQLSSQAYYAAESGVNDAAKAINAGYDQHKTDCGPLPSSDDPGVKYLTDNKVGSGTGASYPCLLINPTPKSLYYNNVGGDAPQIIEITSAYAAQPIKSIKISWQNADGTSNFRSSGDTSFPNSGTWGTTTGVLRASLTPVSIDSDSTVTRAQLITDDFTTFLYPNTGSADYGTVAYKTQTTGGESGVIANGQCDSGHTPEYCNVTITGLNSLNYFLAVRSIYTNSSVTITAYNEVNQPVEISNAQALVDSTGKSQDVLKRIQARVPLRNSYSIPDFVVEGGGSGICKQLQVYPNSTIPRGGGAGCSP